MQIEENYWYQFDSKVKVKISLDHVLGQYTSSRHLMYVATEKMATGDVLMRFSAILVTWLVLNIEKSILN